MKDIISSLPIMKKIEWPEGKQFAVFLSHDVDRVRKTYQFFTHFIIEKRPYHLFSIFQRPNPYWSFEKIMDIEKKYEVRSTFFFLKETKKLKIFHPSTYFLSLGHYDFNESAVKQMIEKLDEGGWEIGLHGSYDSYNNKDLMLKEKKELEKVLGKPVIGVRQHFLNLEIPKTWEIQKAIGFYYDSTFGYKDKVGFRDERFMPFRPFKDNFLIIPLTVMDGTLFSKFKDDKSRWDTVKDAINLAEKKGGLISFLWHQRVFNENEFPRWSKMYEKIIKECKEKNAWFATGEDVYKRIIT
jgi:peptidoglycan/xylan/chitin deacetylase (PgdA/CDA1 family)